MPDIRIVIHREQANLFIESEIGRRWIRVNMEVDYNLPYITVMADSLEELINLMKLDDIVVEN